MTVYPKKPSVQQAEFYWDNDPGIGNATALQSLDGNFNQALEQLIASNIDVPTQGIHVLGLRVKTKTVIQFYFLQGYYGQSCFKYTKHKNTVGRYFWDNDLVKAQAIFTWPSTVILIKLLSKVLNQMVFPSSGNRVLIFVLKTKTETGDKCLNKRFWFMTVCPKTSVQQAEFVG